MKWTKEELEDLHGGEIVRGRAFCTPCNKILPYNGDWYCEFCPECADAEFAHECEDE